MTHLRLLLAIALLAASGLAPADPFHFKFAGTLTQVNFDPASTFGSDVGVGTRFRGRVDFNTDAVDSVADPAVGSYTLSDFAALMTLNLPGTSLPGDDFVNISVVDNPSGPDQYSVLAGRDEGGGSGYTMTIFLQGPSTLFSSDALPLTPPPLDQLSIRSFTLEGTEMRGGVPYQYELIGVLDQFAVPEPGSLSLFGLGLAAAAAVCRRRHALASPAVSLV